MKKKHYFTDVESNRCGCNFRLCHLAFLKRLPSYWTKAQNCWCKKCIEAKRDWIESVVEAEQPLRSATAETGRRWDSEKNILPDLIELRNEALYEGIEWSGMGFFRKFTLGGAGSYSIYWMVKQNLIQDLIKNKSEKRVFGRFQTRFFYLNFLWVKKTSISLNTSLYQAFVLIAVETLIYGRSDNKLRPKSSECLVFCYGGKAFCYLWRQKTTEPYSFVDWKSTWYLLWKLEIETMKIFRIDPKQILTSPTYRQCLRCLDVIKGLRKLHAIQSRAR